MFLSCVLRGGRDTGIFSRSCLGRERGVRHAWDWEHGHSGHSGDFGGCSGPWGAWLPFTAPELVSNGPSELF